MKKFLSYILASINKTFLVRAYVIGLIYLAMGFKMLGQNTSDYVLITLCYILYPFSKLVYNEIRTFLTMGTLWVFNGLFMIVAKFFINMVLFFLSPFIPYFPGFVKPFSGLLVLN